MTFVHLKTAKTEKVLIPPRKWCVTERPEGIFWLGYWAGGETLDLYGPFEKLDQATLEAYPALP